MDKPRVAGKGRLINRIVEHPVTLYGAPALFLMLSVAIINNNNGVTTLPGKSWNLVRPFSRPGKSWKTAKVMESHGK